MDDAATPLPNQVEPGTAPILEKSTLDGPQVDEVPGDPSPALAAESVAVSSPDDLAGPMPVLEPVWLGGLVLALVVGGIGGLWLGRRRPARRLPTSPSETQGAQAASVVSEAAAPSSDPAEGESILDRMRGGLARTTEGFGKALAAVLGRDKVDEALFEALEEALLIADVGVRTTSTLLDRLRKDVAGQDLQDPVQLRGLLHTAMLELFEGQDRSLCEAPEGAPTVVLVVGVNGSGKTTTIGKLAARYGRAGAKVLLGAGDTFRAGAIDQLRVWSDRAGADFVAHQEGADPAAVLYDALEAALARGSDVVLCDTAGRLQSTKPLMAELEKVHRVVGKAVPDAPHEVLLVLDATMGQNALSQARVFGEATGVTGVVLTKLDGTAKGGIVLAIAAELGLPVKFIGVGEQVDDLRPFHPEAFVQALLEPAGVQA